MATATASSASTRRTRGDSGAFRAIALMVPNSRMRMDRDNDAENADQMAAPPVDESLEPTDKGEDLDAKADTTWAAAEGDGRCPQGVGPRTRG